MQTKWIPIAMTVLAAVACGRDTQDQEKTSAAQQPQQGQNQDAYPPQPKVSSPDYSAQAATSAEIYQDTELLGQEVTQQIDMGTSAIADLEQSANGLGLLPLQRSRAFTLNRECEVADGDVVISLNYDFERSWSFDGPLRKASNSVVTEGSGVRTWSKDGVELACDEDGKHVALKRADLEGVTMVQDITRSRTTATSLSDLSRSTSFKAESRLEIQWTSVESSDQLYLDKVVAGTMSRTFTAKKADGSERTISMNAGINAEAPLVVSVVRDQETGVALEKTIVSGSIVRESSERGTLVATFDNVRYVRGDGCFATGGKINGSLTEPSATEPKLTFEIRFENGGKYIEFSDGRNYEFVPEGCDLETLDGMGDI